MDFAHDFPMGRRSGDPLIAKRIYAAWTATGLTHKEIANRLPGRDERYVYEATKGIRGIRPSDLLPLAQALGVRVGVLLGEDHPDEPSQFVQRIGVLEHYLDHRACQTVLGVAELEAIRGNLG